MVEMTGLRITLNNRNSNLYSKFKGIEEKAEKLSEYQQLYGDTLNGLTHIKDVESKIDRLIPDSIKEDLTDLELFVLLSAIYLHDIGKIKSYKNHPEVSKKIINDLHEQLGIDKCVAGTIAKVAYGHGNNNIDELPETLDIDGYGNINIRYIAAILRLGDELSITYQRAPEFLRILLEGKDIQIDKWNLRENIAGIIIDPTKWTIEIQVLSPPKNSEVQFKKLQDYIQNRLDDIIPTLNEKDIFYQRIRLKIYRDTDVEKIIRKRKDVTVDEWRNFYINTERRLWIMGQSMRDAFEEEKDREIIINLIKEGKDCRVLLLNSYEDSQQIYELDKELSQKSLKTSDISLKVKIEGTLKILSNIQSYAREKKYTGKLVVKITDKIMYCSMSIVDDTMYVNPYSNNPEGDKCPTLLLKKKEDEGLFDFYEEEFNRMWRTAEYPQERINGMDINKRFIQYYNDIKTIRNCIGQSNEGNKSNIILPLPKMAFVYPTYKCSLGCPGCMYGSYRKKYSEKGINLDIDVDQFKHILEDLSDLGVNHIEISGGGEPLEHENIDRLIDIIADIRKKKNYIKFGLLTNGLNLIDLETNTLDSIAQNFTYIRLSYPVTQNDTITKMKYLNNLCHFYKKYIYNQEPTNDNSIRLGAKILLTKENKSKILDLIKEVYDMGANHVRIKSIRIANDELSEDEIFRIEDELCAYKFTNPKKEDLQIDIRKTDFPNNFHCWINPLCTTIDPFGRIFICYNFHNDDINMEIGKYSNNASLTDFWGKNDHIEKIKAINVNRICKSSNACNCRFVNYQNDIEEIMRYDEALRFKFQKYFETPHEMPTWWSEIYSFL